MAQTKKSTLIETRQPPVSAIAPDGQTINKTEEDRIVEEIERNGFSVIKYDVDEKELQDLRDSIDEIYRIQMEEAKKANPGSPAYNDYHPQILLAYDERFLNMAMNPEVIAIVKRFLGEYFVLRWQTGIINRPNITDVAYSWHRDLVYQTYTSSPPLAISALYCLVDFSLENGGTHVLPGSHKHILFPSDEFVENFAQPIAAPAGSIMVFDPMMFHRAGLNTSLNMRHAVSHVYCTPIMKSPVSIPRVLKGKYKDDPKLRDILGYTSETIDSLEEWRRLEHLKDGYTG